MMSVMNTFYVSPSCLVDNCKYWQVVILMWHDFLLSPYVLSLITQQIQKLEIFQTLFPLKFGKFLKFVFVERCFNRSAASHLNVIDFILIILFLKLINVNVVVWLFWVSNHIISKRLSFKKFYFQKFWRNYCFVLLSRFILN